MIQSSDRELAELRFGSGHGQKKTTKNNNKSRAEQEPRSAHGRAVNKSRVKQEPRSAHGRAVNKSRAEQEPRSAHGRAVNKKFAHKSKELYYKALIGFTLKTRSAS